MAEEEQEEAQTEEQEAAPKKSKGPALLVGAIFGVIALGAGTAFMAIPAKEKVRRFEGPFHFPLFEEKFNANLRDNQQRRYLQALLDCMYFAYDETYLPTRATDPLYDPIMRDAVGRVISSKTLDDAYQGAAREAFLAELRDALNPVLFPVHIGETALPMDRDEVSGLRPGLSFARATFRGGFHDHTLTVNAAEKTLQLDDNEPVSYEGWEEDIPLTTQAGTTLYVDVTEVQEDFVGEVKIGVHGRLRQLFARELIAQ